jgi:tRNA(Ile2) C34 agmatinyltransferase TiaS
MSINTINPCPKCGCPMADYSTPDEISFRCEECGASYSERINKENSRGE